MTDNEEPKELRQNLTDLAVATGRAAANLVPVVGPFLAEVIGSTIPKQRMDRVAKFATELEGRLDSFERDLMETQLSNEEFAVLLEEGLRQAAGSTSDERRSYIASLIVNGLTSEQIEYAESRYLLRILGEVNDIEVIWLRFYRVPTIGGDSTFREKHKEVLQLGIPNLRSTPDERNKYALRESYKEHLAQLGLLQPRYRTDMQTRTPEFNSITGAMEVSGYRLTSLGRLLLREVGLGEDEQDTRGGISEHVPQKTALRDYPLNRGSSGSSTTGS